jgi:hypothetical protein
MIDDDGYGYLTVGSKTTLTLPVCGDCGAVVGDKKRHSMWHVDAVEGHRHSMVLSERSHDGRLTGPMQATEGR